MKLKTVFLCLCVLGVVLPFYHFIPWLRVNGLDVPLLFQQLFATRVGAFFGMDLLVSAVALFVLMVAEGKRLQMKHLWLPMLGTLCVGVSFGLPLFLYMRERRLEQNVQ